MQQLFYLRMKLFLSGEEFERGRREKARQCKAEEITPGELEDFGSGNEDRISYRTAPPEYGESVELTETRSAGLSAG